MRTRCRIAKPDHPGVSYAERRLALSEALGPPSSTVWLNETEARSARDRKAR